MRTDHVVAVGSESDVVLCDPRHVDVSSGVNTNVRCRLVSDTSSTDDPLEGPVGTVELRNEHLGVGHVDRRASKICFTGEIARHDDVAHRIDCDGLWDAGIGGGVGKGLEAFGPHPVARRICLSNKAIKLDGGGKWERTEIHRSVHVARHNGVSSVRIHVAHEGDSALSVVGSDHVVPSTVYVEGCKEEVVSVRERRAWDVGVGPKHE